MSIFSKKTADDTFDETDADTGTGFVPPPGAPAMPRQRQRKGRSVFQVILLLTLLAAGGAGYYYLGAVAEDGGPARAPAPHTAINTPMTTTVNAPVTAENALAAPAAIPSPATATPADLPPPAMAATTPPPAAAPEIAPPPLPAATAGADIPKDLNVVPAAPVDPSHEPATTATPTVVNATAPDLPAPKPVVAAPAQNPPPSAAERAIVENAPVLDQLTHPAEISDAQARAITAPAGVTAQQAIVRPMPTEYVVVKKNHGSGDLDARLEAARSALAQDRVQAALELFDDLGKQYPRDNRVLMGRAVALQKSGQTEAALAAYEAVLTAQPKNLEALTNMLGLLRSQDPNLALSKLKELRDDYPANADIAAQLGVSYGVSGDYASALKYLDMADALKPGMTQVLYNRAVVYDKMGNGGSAAALYRQLLQRAAEGGLDQQLPLEAIRGRLAVLR